MQKTILILGGTGLLGAPVTRQLLAEGFNIRVLARTQEKAAALFGESVEIWQGDVTDSASLEQAMTGCDGVHISVGGPVDQISAEQVAALAPKLGVTHITYISGASVTEETGWFPMIQQKLLAEQAIRDCGVPYTILCPTWPMEMLTRYARNGEPFLIGDQFNPIDFFAADDLGRMVATAYQTEKALNKRFFIHGPEGITMPDALRRYCAVVHPDVADIQIMPIAVARNIATQTNNPMLAFGAELMAYFETVTDYGNPFEANITLGAPQTTLDNWLQQARK